MRLTAPVVASTQFFDRGSFSSRQSTTVQAAAGLTALSTVLTFSGVSPAFVELITIEVKFAAAPAVGDKAGVRLISVSDSVGSNPIEFDLLIVNDLVGQQQNTRTFATGLFVPIGEGFRVEADAAGSTVAVDATLAVYGIVFELLG